ncbi:MAG: ribosome biogenesis GTPase Der [Mycoplasmataceae bacterium]|jgi:GTP-binding protein|nr:ribosome biogenesis GTPase Der [Mycoplasmataceae bacterium]
MENYQNAVVSIVGKPNVGKSTLFNRIIGRKKSIVDDSAGVTRDRIYAEAHWLNQKFRLIDTGGLTNENFSFKDNIKQQVELAIKESNVILFVVSNKDGVSADDYYVSKLLKKLAKDKKVILVVNKSENKNFDNEKQYFSLGFGNPNYVSAEHSNGIGIMLDETIKNFERKQNIENDESSFSFCIIGRTNVGKSTLVNAILNEDRMITSPIQHTTRDAIDVDFSFNNKKYTIVDTAGIRRKGKIDGIEKFAVMRTEGAIAHSKLIILVLDCSEEFNEQDEVIGGLAYDAHIPVIICVNKYDKIQKHNNSIKEIEAKIRFKFKFLSFAPIVYISALTKYKIEKIFSLIELIREQTKIKINTTMLNRVLNQAVINNPPGVFKGGRLNLSYMTQVEGQIPTFVIFTNDPKHLHFTYERYIENKIRESFGITVVPTLFYYKDKNSRIRNETKE